MMAMATSEPKPALSKRLKRLARKIARLRRLDRRAIELERDRIYEARRQAAAAAEPWRVLLSMTGADGHALIDMQAEQAADEIRAVYSAIVRSTLRAARLAASRSAGGMPDIPDGLARAHAQRYLPWTERVGKRVADAVIAVVHDNHWTGRASPQEVADALNDYARNGRQRA